MSGGGLIRRKPPFESAAVAGIAYAMLSGVTVTLLRGVDVTLPDGELVSWYGDNTNRSRIVLALSLASIAAVMFLWFVAVIRRRVGDLEDRFFATVFFGSAIVWVVVWLAGVASVAAVPLAQQMGGTWELTADAVRVSQGLAAAWLLLIGPRIQAVFVVSTSTVFLRTSAPEMDCLPRVCAGVGSVRRSRCVAGYSLCVPSLGVSRKRYDPHRSRASCRQEQSPD